MRPNQIFDSFVHYTTLFSLLKPCRWQLLGTGLFEKIPVPISKSPVPISKGPVPISPKSTRKKGKSHRFRGGSFI